MMMEQMVEKEIGHAIDDALMLEILDYATLLVMQRRPSTPFQLAVIVKQAVLVQTRNRRL
jgi:hypothetical protein